MLLESPRQLQQRSSVKQYIALDPKQAIKQPGYEQMHTMCKACCVQSRVFVILYSCAVRPACNLERIERLAWQCCWALPSRCMPHCLADGSHGSLPTDSSQVCARVAMAAACNACEVDIWPQGQASGMQL